MFKGKPIAAIEADIAMLDKRRVALEARHQAAVAASLVAVGERRRLLVESDEVEPKALAGADHAYRESEDAAAAAADALDEVGSRLADARERLARLRAAEAREAAAAALEASAKGADAAVARIAKAVAEIDRARADLTAVITSEAACCYAPPSLYGWNGQAYLTNVSRKPYDGSFSADLLLPEIIASRIVGHLVAPAMPSLAVADQAEAQGAHLHGAVTHILGPIANVEAARALLSDGMRAAAAEARRTPDDPRPA